MLHYRLKQLVFVFAIKRRLLGERKVTGEASGGRRALAEAQLHTGRRRLRGGSSIRAAGLCVSQGFLRSFNDPALGNPTGS